MIKRLEHIAALVVAAGLAIVSYWLFFSWAQGGGADHRRLPPRQQERSGWFVPAEHGEVAITVDGRPRQASPGCSSADLPLA